MKTLSIDDMQSLHDVTNMLKFEYSPVVILSKKETLTECRPNKEVLNICANKLREIADKIEV